MAVLTCGSEGSLLFMLHCNVFETNFFAEDFFRSVLQITALVPEIQCSLLEKQICHLLLENGHTGQLVTGPNFF